MNKIKIGWSEVSIVPDGRRIDLAGQFYERISGEVETPISVTAMAMECGDDAMVFVSCDLGGTSRKLLEAVRDNIPDGIGFPKEKLIINAIHTHTSMGYANSSDAIDSSFHVIKKMLPEGKVYQALVSDQSSDILRGEEAFAFLVERITKAAVSAWESRKEGLYASGFGRAAVGMCRRVCYDDGSAKMWGDSNSANFTELESGNDSGIELLFTYDLDKKLTGVVANVACPAQVLEHQSFISSDYMGKLRLLIREKYGDEICLLGLISPAGDMCPRDMVRWVDAEIKLNDPNIFREKIIPRRQDPSMFDIKGCEKAARRIANEVFWALDEVTEYVSETELVHKTLTVDLPFRRVTIEEKDKAVAVMKEFFEKCPDVINYQDNADMFIYTGTIARFESQKTRDVYPIEMHVVKLGDLAFATNPFELFLNYANQIRARSLAKQTFLIQLCCGTSGYLPTERAERGGHYSAIVSSGNIGHVGGEMLVRKTLKEINEMFGE